MPERHVVILAFPGMQSLDAVGPFEVFSGAGRAARSLGRSGGYRVTLASVEGSIVRTESGLALGSVALEQVDGVIDTLVLPGGSGVKTARHLAPLRSWITAAAPQCRRVAAVCSGAFLAAEAGLLDGRRVTTHWARAEELAEQFPLLHVDADPIYLRDGKFWTSAGITAGIDLALALVQDDLGAEVAQVVARWLVMFLHRPGGQTQFASPVWVPRAERLGVRQAQLAVENNPGADHRVPALAATAGMSERHFARVFAAQVGETPGHFVERVRAEAARRDLETTDDVLDIVARRCGFGTSETLRRVFQRQFNVTPDSYRRRFRLVRHSERTPA